MQSPSLEPRFARNGPLAYRIWILWAVIAFALTLGPLHWFLDYFAKTGPYLGHALAIMLAGLLTLAWAHHRLWPRRLQGLEARIFAVAAAGLTLLYEPRATLAVGAFALACYGLGAAALSRLGAAPETALERIAVRTGAGLGLWVAGLIPLGLLGWFSPWLFLALTLLCLLAFRRRLGELAGDLRRLDAAWREVAATGSPIVSVVTVFFPAFVLAFWLAALAPSTATDALAFHLPAARHYLQSGSLAPLPVLSGIDVNDQHLYTTGHSVGYGYYPQSFETLLTVAWGLDGQPAAQLISPLFALLAGLMTGAIGRRCGLSRTATLLGIGAGLALPVVSWNGAIAKNDAMLTFFQFAALWAVLVARERETGRRLLLAAFFLGVGFGTKHVALYGGIPIGLLMLDRLRRVRRPVGLAFALAAVFAVTGLSWHARTWRATGNPLFPASIGFAKAALPEIGGRRVSVPPWVNRARYPWIAHFRGRMTLESPLHNPLGFCLVFFAPAWLLLRRRSKSPLERDCLIFCAVFAAYWLYTWPVLRYGTPLVLTLVMLTAHRVEGLLRAPDRWVRRAAAAALAYGCFALALPAALIIEVNVHQLRYFAGRIDREAYLRTLLDQYSALEFLNARMQHDERALATVNCINVYADDPMRYRCLNLGMTIDEDDVEALRSVVAAWSPDYLALPVGSRGELAWDAVSGLGFGGPIYEDAAFRVYGR